MTAVRLDAMTATGVMTAAGVMTATGVMTSPNGWPSSPQPSRRNCDVTAVGAMTAMSPAGSLVAMTAAVGAMTGAVSR